MEPVCSQHSCAGSLNFLCFQCTKSALGRVGLGSSFGSSWALYWPWAATVTTQAVLVAFKLVLLGLVILLQIPPSAHCCYWFWLHENIIKPQSCPIQKRFWWKNSQRLSFITPKARAMCLCASRSSLLCGWKIDVSWSALGVQGCIAKWGKTCNFTGIIKKLIIKVGAQKI